MIWKERDWKLLLDSLRRGNCILLLGEEADGIETLRAELVTELLKELTRDEPKTLAQVAKLYARQLSRSDLELKIAEFYSSRTDPPSTTHMNLAALPFYFVITSCHDELMRAAFKKVGKTGARSEFYNYKGEVPILSSLGSEQSPLVYHLYGGVQEPRSLVVTDTDLLDFLVNVISKNPPVPTRIQSELANSDKTFLFLGFGIKHWYLRVLVHFLRAHRPTARSFAMEGFGDSISNDLEQTVFFYRDGYLIDVYNGDVAEFVEHLKSRWHQFSTAQPQPLMPELDGADRPSVFISYGRQDAGDVEAADSMFNKMVNMGLRPYMDRKDLRTGDRWEDVIHDLIGKKVGYFVVLLSSALESRDESVVWEEVDLALKRQKRIPDRSFIFPYKVNDCSIPRHLKDVHIAEAGLTPGELIKMILADHSKRQLERTP